MAREQYQVQWKDYYRILQVPPGADAPAIVAAYRRLAQVYHPDRNHRPDATQRFQEIKEAKEVLSDPRRRAIYDAEYLARQNGGLTEETRERPQGNPRPDWAGHPGGNPGPAGSYGGREQDNASSGGARGWSERKNGETATGGDRWRPPGPQDEGETPPPFPDGPSGFASRHFLLRLVATWWTGFPPIPTRPSGSCPGPPGRGSAAA